MACMAIFERFVILLYDHKSDLSSVNEARTEMFGNKQSSIVNIPPTLATLKQHVRRAVLQVYDWIKVPECNSESRDNADRGWVKGHSGWTPFWSVLPEAIKACYELIKCGCQAEMFSKLLQVYK